MRRWVLLIILILTTVLPFAQAQDTERYENPEFGLAFDLPTGWEVRTTIDTLLAGTPDALAALEAGGTPDSLVIRVVTGSFVDLKVENASLLPDQLTRLVPTGVTAPSPVEASYGNMDGWEIEYTVEANNLASKVAILPLQNGRLALVRGMASIESWTSSAAAEYEALKASLEFSIPTSQADPLANVPDEDGGVIWHYQAPQPGGAQPVTLGGISYDPFQLMYAAAGQRGILVLDQTTGAFVNYLGPFFDDDNITDLVVGIDAKIYAANATPGDNNQIMIVNRAGRYESGFGATGEAPGEFAPGMPHTIAVTRGSDIWTVSEGHSTEPFNRLYRFDKFGNLLKMIDLTAVNPDLKNVRLDNNLATGGLYLIGETGGLNLLDSDGEALVTNLALDVFAITTPTEIAIAPGDNIIVGTSSEGFLQFAPSGALLDRFGLPFDPARTDGFQPGEVLHPAGMVVLADGTIFFAETNPNTGMSQVQGFRFAGDGNLALPNRPGSGQGVNDNLGIDPALGGGKIEYGAVVQGALNNQTPLHRWQFEGAAGDTIRITMRDVSASQSLDTQINLINPNLVEIAVNDDISVLAPEGFRETDSVIEMTINVFGLYTIEATRFGGRGEYELTLEKVN